MENPDQPKQRGRKETRPWSTMAVGDAFFVSAKDAMPSSVRGVAYKKGIDLERKFSVSRAEGGVSVTRVE